MHVTNWLATLLLSLCSLVCRLNARFTESGKTFYVGTRKDSKGNYTSETIYMQFNAMRVNDINCFLNQTSVPSPEFRIKNFTLQNSTYFKLSPLIVLNVSAPSDKALEINQIKILPRNDTFRVLDYKVYKKNSTCYTELLLQGNHSNHSTPSTNHFTVSTVFVKDVCLNTPDFLNSPVYNFSMPNSLQYFQTQEMDEFYDLIYSTSGEITKLEFRVGSMTRDTNALTQAIRNKPDLNQQNYRKLLLTELREPWISTTNFLNTRLTKFVMLPLSAYNVDYKQFIVFERNTTVIYLITNYNGIQKTSNSSMQMSSLPFNISRISYANAEFLMFEEPLTLPDVNGQPVSTFANYYLKLPLGKKLEIGDLKEVKFLTRGRYLSTFTTLQRTLQLYDFEMPDLDGLPNETPITTLYYSKTQETFAPFLEEKTNHYANSSFHPGSYYRITMETHGIELYKYNASASNMMLLTNRITGQQLPEANLNRDGEIYSVRYLSSHNMLLIKFVESQNSSLPSTILLVIQNPFLIVTITPEGPLPNLSSPSLLPDWTRSPQSRSLQVKMSSLQNSTSNFSVMCPSDNNSSEFVSVFNVSFMVVYDSLDYFTQIQPEIKEGQNKMNSYFQPKATFKFDDIVIGGMDATFHKSTFIRGSFFVQNFGDQVFTDFGRNQNLKKEIYKVSPSSLEINTFIVYQAIRGRRLFSTLAIDMDNSTEYFELFANEFKFKRTALDNREISNVDIIDTGDVMLNVSRNIFVLDFDTLQEKPLAGVGSFCKSIIMGKIYNIPDVLVCLSDGTLFAHYISERYSTKQTRITLLQIPDADMLDKLNPINMIYTSHFPGWLIFLSDRSTKGNVTIDYSFNIIDIYSFMSVHVIKHARIDNLKELNQEMNITNNKIIFVECIENTIIIVTSRLNFFLYLVKDTWAAGPSMDHITFLRSVSLESYFQSHKYMFANGTTAMDVSYSLNITRFETIKLLKEPNSDTTYQGERDFDNRLAFLLQITGRSGESTSVLNLGVILNHGKSSFEAFQVIVRGDPCEKLLMGPAFLVKAEIQQKSLAFICISDAKAKPPVMLNIHILESILDEITFSRFSGAGDIFDYSKPSEVVDHAQSFSVVFTKPHHLVDIALAKQKRIAKFDSAFLPQITLKQTVNLDFSEPYRIFKTKQYLPPSLTEFKVQPHTASMADIFRNQSTTYIQHKIQDYFDGHIFQTKVLCESMVECREKVINGTVELIFTGSLADYPDYGSFSRYRISTIKLPKSYNPDFQITYILTKDFYKYSYQNKVYNTQLNNLGDNCTDFAQYEEYLIGVCEYNQSRKNFLRVFDMNRDLSFFEIHFTLDASRALLTKELMISIKQDYLILYTFNGVFNRYLSVHVFKLVQNLNYADGRYTRFFSNRLKTNLALVYLFSTPMNDEFIEFKSYPVLGSNPPLDRIVFWSLRRNDKKSIIMRTEGWEIQQLTNPNETSTLNFTRFCDDQRFHLEFKLASTTGSNYLLDFAKILPLESEDPLWYDVILNLPYAQDYLLRVNRSGISYTSHLRNLDVKEHLRILSISNPFFGLKMKSYLPPVFWNGLYITTTNFIPDLSVMRMYYLGSEEKNKSKALNTAILFNYQDTEFGDKRNSLEEKELETIYTFGVVNYKQYLLSVSLLDPQIKLGDFNYTQQATKRERDLYLLFVNGTFNILRISNHLQLGISRSYLASNKLTLRSFGPKTVINLDVTLKDNNLSIIEALIFVIHTMITVSFAGGLAWALYLWQKRRPEDMEDEPDLQADSGPIRLHDDAKSGDSPSDRRNLLNGKTETHEVTGAVENGKEAELSSMKPRIAESTMFAGEELNGHHADRSSLSPVVSDDDEEVDSEEFQRQLDEKRQAEEAASSIKMPQSKAVDSDPED